MAVDRQSTRPDYSLSISGSACCSFTSRVTGRATGPNAIGHLTVGTATLRRLPDDFNRARFGPLASGKAHAKLAGK